jgi:hypothetical protein
MPDKDLIGMRTLKWDDRLPLGTYVKYHHRAGVARHKRHTFLHEDSPDTRKGWILVAGTLPNESVMVIRNNIRVPAYMLGDEEVENLPKINKMYTDRIKDMFYDWPQALDAHKQKINKTVMVWPDDGSGWIMGKIRKSIGVSSPGGIYGGGYFEPPEWEPGYHHTLMYVDLYVVKVSYEGTNYVLCPLWAVNGNG